MNLPGGAESVLPSSTGVIGWRLPAKELAGDVIPAAIKNLQAVSAFNAARDIMTTDRYPKLRSKTLSNGARIVGIAKGMRNSCWVPVNCHVNQSNLLSLHMA